MINKGVNTRLVAVFFAVVFVLFYFCSCDGFSKNITKTRGDGVETPDAPAPSGGANDDGGNGEDGYNGGGSAPDDGGVAQPNEPDIDMPPVSSIKGGGTFSDPYLIETAADINYLNTYNYAVFLLKNNVDFSGAYLSPIGNITAPFNGKFLNPDNFTLSNLTVSADEFTNVGFFGVLGSDAIVDGLRLENISFIISDGATSLNLGAVCGVSYGIINNCRVSGVKIDISNSLCNIGGLAGLCINGEICDSHITGKITVGGAANNVGSVVGQSSGGKIESIASSCDISAINRCTAGAVGKSESSLIKSVETHDIIKAYKAGGIVGDSQSDMISGCAVVAELYGGILGGMLGEVLYETAINNSTFSGKLVYSIEAEIFRVIIGGVVAISEDAQINLTDIFIDAEIICAEVRRFIIAGVTAASDGVQISLTGIIIRITAYSLAISDIYLIYPDAPLYDNAAIDVSIILDY